MSAKTTSWVHLIGIGGTGLSAIARVLLESGYTVSGSDRYLSPLAESLRQAGVQVFVGHRAENVGRADVVVRSSAIPDDNVEVRAAQAANIPVLKRADFLGQLMSGRLGIAVAGTHGKTTTTAMLAWVLTALGQDPSFIIGGVSNNLGTNARAGQGQIFVIEADEYDRMFLGLRPRVAVVTSIEHDHPDCYPSAADFYQAFLDFAECLPEESILLACGDDRGAARLLQETADRGQNALSYGIWGRDYDYLVSAIRPNQQGCFTFEATCNLQSETYQTPLNISLQVPGKHNVLNALATVAVVHQLGLPVEGAAQALGAFQGTGRRFELRGEVSGVAVIDDYAHHPTEIQSTLNAARMRYPGRRLWAVWQPHTYSRTRTLFDEFANAFLNCDHVLVTEIYPSREPPPVDGFSSRQVVAAMQHPDVHYMADLNQATAFLLGRLEAGDVLLVMSAGDADQISTHVLAALQDREPEYKQASTS